MLDQDTKRRIDTARQILVGKIPDPKAQVEQITTALIYKFMDDMDRQNEELGGKATFLIGKLKAYSWGRLLSKELSGQERMIRYMDALTAFSKAEQIPELFRTIFKGAFLPYRDAETLNLFLKGINGFVYDHSEDLGNAFEYLLSILGSQGEAGQFRTPRHIIDFIVEVVDPKKTDKILDPACGTAGFLISSYKHIKHQNSSNFKFSEYVPSFSKAVTSDVSLIEIQSNGQYKGDKLTPDDRKKLGKNIIGYDISPDMVRLSLVNMYLHGFNTPQIFEYDTLTYEDRWGDNFDVILANPPFMSPKGGIRPHKRFRISANRSEVLFVDYIAEHLTLKGRAGVIVPEGIVFQSANAYRDLRRMLIEDEFLWAVVSLPAGVFNPYANVKTSILFIDRERSRRCSELLFVKIESDGFDLGAQRKTVDSNDLPQAFSVLKSWQQGTIQESGLAQWIPKQSICSSKDYNLTPDRYRRPILSRQSKWPVSRLGDVCIINPKKNEVRGLSTNTKVSFVPMSALNENEIDFQPKEVRPLGDVYRGYTYFRDGDVLLAKVTPCFENGKSGVARNLSQGIGFGTTELIVLRPTDKVLSEWIYYAVSSTQFKERGVRQMSGTGGLQRLSKHFVENYLIPVPSLSQQRKIIQEIEEERAAIDSAKKAIEIHEQKIENKLADLRQA